VPERILLSFTGSHDPYNPTVVEGEDQPGPILTLVQARYFDRLVLFATPRMLAETSATAEAVSERSPSTVVEQISVPLEDPTDYNAILFHLRKECGKICDRHPSASLFVSTASGTPQMHACWLLLAASGEVPSKLLHTRPLRFVSAEKPLVSEIDLASTSLPKVDLGTSPRRPSTGSSDGSDLVDRVVSEIGIVGEHPSMIAALQRTTACAAFPTPILITGETGTGKELFANFAHRLSDRAMGPFVVVNCGAIPAELVESTLFGHKKGAFTGALHDQKGKFETAHGGTLFLDEIGELPLAAQVKFLRVLEDGKIEPVGSNQVKSVNVRIIAATNRRLPEEVKEKRFRQDLYFRLNTAQVLLPPLRERRSDIPRIAMSILQGFNHNVKRSRRISPEALIRLQSYDWPGNVRDLRSVITQAALFCSGDTIGANDLVFEQTPTTGATGIPEPHEGFEIEEYVAGVRQCLFSRALEIANNNQSQAARLLGVKPQAVNSFVKNKSASATS
jgi:DNA-binding NtrC family response regulator